MHIFKQSSYLLPHFWHLNLQISLKACKFFVLVFLDWWELIVVEGSEVRFNQELDVILREFWCRVMFVPRRWCYAAIVDMRFSDIGRKIYSSEVMLGVFKVYYFDFFYLVVFIFNNEEIIFLYVIMWKYFKFLSWTTSFIINGHICFK